MQGYLQAKMADAGARIESLVNDKIKDQRQRLYAQQGAIEAELKAGISERQAQIDKLRVELDAARNTLDARMKELVDSQQQKLKQGGDKLLDDLRKKF
jgi:exonuclease VII large subunit